MIIVASNPFVSAYLMADWFGKGVFWMLFLLSATSWTIIIYKWWQLARVQKLSREFTRLFSLQKEKPFQFQYIRPTHQRWWEVPHPPFEVYKTVKQNALQLIDRNRLKENNQEALSGADLELIETQAIVAAAEQGRTLEKNLFILSTIVTLGPFLGLLGTVWGILITFSQLTHGFSASNGAMLRGLSMALATTVIGLVIAIPALVGERFLKNASRDMHRELDYFSSSLLASIEMQYRKD